MVSIMRPSSTTIQDVAKAANVSVATVSRFINSSAFVLPETAKRIEQAIQDLNYHPNTMARALKTEKTHTIMMIVPDISNAYYAEQYKIIQRIGEQNQYTTILYNSNQMLENELHAISLAMKHRCDGLIFQSVFRNTESARLLKSLQIPVVTPRYFENKKDYEPAIYNTTRYLISLGHKKIIYVGGAKQSWINTCRRNGFEKAMSEAGLMHNPEEWYETEFSPEAGYSAGKSISTLKDKPTAICAANDQLAIGLMLAFQETGIRVPEDISVTGMDDNEYARLLAPPLTTVRNDPAPHAKYMIEKLLHLMGNDISYPESHSISQSEVIVRGSTRHI